MPKLPLFLKADFAQDIEETIKFAAECGYSGIVTTLVNPGFKREFVDDNLASQQHYFTRNPATLPVDLYHRYVVPYVRTPNLGLDVEEIRVNNERRFLQELHFALHVNCGGTIAISLENQNPEALATCLKNVIGEKFDGKFVVEVPMVDPRVASSAHSRDLKDEMVGNCQWSVWNKFFAATGQSSHVELALVLTPELPPEEELRRWLGEIVGLLVIPHDCFLGGNGNYPVLPTKHHEAVTMFLQYTRCGVVVVPKGIDDLRIKDFADCVRFYSKLVKSSMGVEDSLRFPLQPLYDNLDTSTYEIFEEDPRKYVAYQRAIEAAMVDKVPDSEKESRKLVLMILGAGRGPFIRAALNACANTGRKLKILVVEKNPNAIVTLASLIEVMWPDKDITLFSEDMRHIKLVERADIIVSELLGSLGDNELSPECLDGAQRLLKPDGISIPCNSISYLRPVMASRTRRVLNESDNIKVPGTDSKKLPPNPTEVGWLVLLSNAYYIDEAKELFKFVHPNSAQPIDNSRYKKLEFEAKIDCRLDGFAGYFTSKLYKDIEISIHPATHTPGLISWFPVFVPSRQNIEIKKGEKISIEFWRKIQPNVKVWYEWRVQDEAVSNVDGKYHPIKL